MHRNANLSKIERGIKMNICLIIILWVLLAIALVGLGFNIGRDYTKLECGKMLVWLEHEGYLQRPDGEYNDDEEDIK